jgi:hypothetical protein
MRVRGSKSEETGFGGDVEGWAPAEPILIEAADLLRDGKLLPARRRLIEAHRFDHPEQGESAAVEEALWKLDLRLRHRMLDALTSALRDGDEEGLDAVLERLRRLLGARREDLRSYLRLLEVETPFEPMKRAEVDLVGEEAALRDGLDSLRQGRREEAVDHFRMALECTDQGFRAVKILGDRSRASDHDEAASRLRKAARSAKKAESLVWGGGGFKSARPQRGPEVLGGMFERLESRGLDAVLADVDEGRRTSAKPPPREGPGAPEGAPMAANGGGGGPAAPVTLRRTPHLELSRQEPIPPESSFTVEVYADQQAALPGEESTEVEVELPPGVERLPLRVTLLASSHFRVEGEAVRPLTLERDRPDTERVAFTLAVRSADELRALLADPASPRAGRITALFEHEGRPCGKVSRSVALDVALPGAGASAPPAEPATPQPRLAVEVGAQPPDLLVRVIDEARDGRQFLCRVSTPLLPEGEVESRFVPWNLPQVTRQIVRDYMDDFVSKSATPRIRRAALVAAGRKMFNASPKNFKALFWKLVDAGKPPRSIAIVSDEPYIPWELMVPYRAGEERKPLGVEFMVGRWTTEEGTAGQQAIRISDSLVVAPSYTGSRKLAHAEPEAALVTGKFPGSRVQPADLDTIDTTLKGSQVTLLHFTCHGAESDGDSQVIDLDAGGKLESGWVGGLEGFKALFGRRGTLVFLNACDVGRSTPALVGIGGFASEFIQLGAVAVIAPMWSVRDSLAHEIAVKVYDGITADPPRPFAEIFQEIRREAYEGAEAEDTYAAYCFYGDPLAHLA